MTIHVKDGVTSTGMRFTDIPDRVAFRRIGTKNRVYIKDKEWFIEWSEHEWSPSVQRQANCLDFQKESEFETLDAELVVSRRK